MTSLSRLLQELQRLVEALHEADVERREAAGMTTLDRRLLGLLEALDRPATSQRLARALLCPGSEVDSRLRVLQECAWVSTVTAGGGPTFEISPTGRCVLTGLRRAERRFEAAIEGTLDDGDLRAGIELLRAVRGCLRAGRQPRRRGRRRAADAVDFDRPRRTSATAGAASLGVAAGGG
jgi:hypothetical protein